MAETDRAELGGRPLAGLTVVDLTSNIAGPSATLILADLGARIVKIEPPGGDASRAWLPQVDGNSTVYLSFNRAKDSVVIDAKRPEGSALIRRLAERADIFVESMRPGKADALGLGWPDLRAVNPRLIYCSVNAFGEAGPMAGVAGFDAVIQAYSGLMELTGYPDGDPARVGGAVIDVGTGTWAALAILAALIQRGRDGEGRHVSMTMLETAVGFMMHHLTSTRLAGVRPERLGTAQHNFAPYQAIHAADRMVMVGINSDGMFRRAVRAIGDPGLADDPRFATNSVRVRNRSKLIAAIERLTIRLPAEEIVARLTAAQIPASVVRDIGALAVDPQLDALQVWGTTSDGKVLPRTPVADPAYPVGEVVEAGAQSRAILEEFGLDAAEIDGLFAQGVVVGAKDARGGSLG